VKYNVPNAVLHGINYGQDFPFDIIDKSDVVYIVDFSLPMDDMIKLSHICNLVWIDHHKSSILEYGEKKDQFGISTTTFLRDGTAACELTWEWFATGLLHSSESVWVMPKAIYLLGRYDVWNFEDVPDCLNFQYGMRNHDTIPYLPATDTRPEIDNMPFWRELFDISKEASLKINPIIEEGKFIQEYEAKQNKKYCGATAFEIMFKGLKCICVNKALTNSIVFDSVYDPYKHDAMLSYYRSKHGDWKVSMYTTHDDVDVSLICKDMKGGGHKKAAGFQCMNIHEVIGYPQVCLDFPSCSGGRSI
jgi:oligoribonuclease NrnB/cAMP/cGMP phosphodiesterase (DHH superfamily)